MTVFEMARHYYPKLWDIDVYKRQANVSLSEKVQQLETRIAALEGEATV